VTGCGPASSAQNAASAPAASSSTPAANASSAVVAQAVKLIKDEALVVPSDAALAGTTSMPALIKTLNDPFARYMDPSRYSAFTDETQNGTYGGIGISLANDSSGRASVASVVIGSPAEAAGIKPGDAILAINGVTRDPWSADEVPVYVKGPVGSSVTLTLQRPGAASPLTLKVTRQQIAVVNVTGELLGRVGYLRVRALSDQTAGDVRTAIDGLTKRGATAWVVDLRDNPGGPIQAGVDLASLFIKSGEVGRSAGRASSQTYSVSGQAVTAAPLVVLVNGYTNGAAEVFAAAIAAHKRGTLVGAKTPGDGSIQTVEKLGDGSAITFTVARLLGPDGKTIDGVGVAPDVAVSMTGDPTGVPATDAQLRAAIARAQGKGGK